MHNPFSNEQIKNYLLLYGAIVAIMVLFYLLNSSLNTKQSYEKKIFEINASMTLRHDRTETEKNALQSSSESQFKLLEKAY